MKKAILVVCLLTFMNSFAQEIKIKKDKILFDGTAVGILDKQKRVYNILTLDGEPKFSVEMKRLALEDGSNAYWYLITDLKTNKTNEITEGPSEGLSGERTIVASVSKGNYKFITTTGIDDKAFSEFINGSQTELSKKYESQNSKIIQDLKTEDDLLIASKVSITKEGLILQPKLIINKKTGVEELKKVILGRIGFQSDKDIVGMSNATYVVSNATNKNIIAKWQERGEVSPISNSFIRKQFTTFDKKLVNLDLDTFLMSDTHTKNIRKFVAKLFYMGYLEVSEPFIILE